MLKLTSIGIFFALSAMATFLLNYFGFAVVHSAALLALAVVVAPGFFIAFFHILPNETITWIVVVVINAIYYQLVYLFFQSKQSKWPGSN
jgi:hypothetical protein